MQFLFPSLMRKSTYFWSGLRAPLGLTDLSFLSLVGLRFFTPILRGSLILGLMDAFFGLGLAGGSCILGLAGTSFILGLAGSFILGLGAGSFILGLRDESLILGLSPGSLERGLIDGSLILRDKPRSFILLGSWFSKS